MALIVCAMVLEIYMYSTVKLKQVHGIWLLLSAVSTMHYMMCTCIHKMTGNLCFALRIALYV